MADWQTESTGSFFEEIYGVTYITTSDASVRLPVLYAINPILKVEKTIGALLVKIPMRVQ